jgi:hypothetical protein
MRRWGILVAALLLTVSSAARAGSPAGASEAYLEGNRLYQSGDYAGAAKAYERVLALGVTAPELEYNLGNAYLKAGRIGPAVLHYRRALRLRPRFESASANLNYARSLTQDVKPDEEASSHWAWVRRLRLGPGVAGAFLFAAFTLFVATGVMRLLWWRERIAATVLQGALGGLALLLVAALVFEWNVLEGRHEGVVVAKETEVRAGPGDQYTVSFRLHEGTEVEILRGGGIGWREIKVSDRLQGWAPDSTVTPIGGR